MSRLFWLLYFFASIIFLAHYYIVGNAVWGDGRYYYVYTRSAIIDHDLDFSNESQTHPFFFESNQTSAGKLFNKYTIGAPLLWTPWFLLAHFLNPAPNPDGYQHLYRILVGLGCVFYAQLGLYLSYLTVAKITSPKKALISWLSLFLATNIFFYSAVDPINSHSAGIFISSLIFYLWFRWKHSLNQSSVIILGLLTGLLAMIRLQDIIFCLPLLIYLYNQSRFSHIFTYLLGIIIGFSPQLIVWQLLLGKIANPYSLNQETFYWLRPQILSVLISNNNGLFYYSPLFILAVIGLLKKFKQSVWAKVGLTLFILQTYIISSWHGWWGGASFGARMFLSLTPYFMLGLAWFLSKNIKIYRFIFLFTVLNFSQILYLLLTN